MAKLLSGPGIVCTKCGTDCSGLRDLALHLLSHHAVAAPVSRDTDPSADGLVTANHELLSKNEEAAIAQLIQEGGPQAQDARNFLVQNNLRLVISIVKKNPHNKPRMSDLIQEGNLGLMRAAELFDPKRGFRFSTYAIWWIRQFISRGSHNTEMVAVPEGSKWKYIKAKRLLAEGVSQEKVLEQLKLTKGTLQAFLMATSRRTVSLDASLGDTDRQSLGSILAVDEAPKAALTAEELDSVLGGLTSREKLVLVRRFGLDGKVPLTLEEAGQELHITRERVRQIEMAALDTLKSRHDRHDTLLSDGAFARRQRGLVDPMPEERKPSAAVVDRAKQAIDSEETVANLKCGKCGKKYKHQKRLLTHESECRDAGDGRVEENPDLPNTPTAEKTSHEAVGGGDAGPLAALIRSEGDVSIKDHTLNMLETIETHYEGKLKQVKVLISAVRNASEPEA